MARSGAVCCLCSCRTVLFMFCVKLLSESPSSLKSLAVGCQLHVKSASLVQVELQYSTDTVLNYWTDCMVLCRQHGTYGAKHQFRCSSSILLNRVSTHAETMLWDWCLEESTQVSELDLVSDIPKVGGLGLQGCSHVTPRNVIRQPVMTKKPFTKGTPDRVTFTGPVLGGSCICTG